MAPPERYPWWVPQLGRQEHLLVREVLDNGFLNDGDVTTRFERALADVTGAKHVVAVTSGTAALFLALRSLGIGPGDEVIVPDMTFIATANAVSLAGATPVFADVDPGTLTLDPRTLAQAITPRTKAFIPVHVSGRVAEMPAILEIAQARGLPVVEDAAQALVSSLDGRRCGTFGALGCLSFSPQKMITTGQGGAVLTNDDALHTRLRELKDQGRPMRGTGGDDTHHSIGFNFKFTNLQAAVGLGQLASLSERVARLRRTYDAYAAGLRGVDGIRLFPFRLQRGETPQWVDAWSDTRDELVANLERRGASCRRFWFPLHSQQPYRQPDDRFPVSSMMARKAFWLPSALTMSDEDVATVCGWIRDSVAVPAWTPRA